MSAIAVVGMACRYPGASSPAELWEDALAGRRAFRRIPPERLRLADYGSPDRSVPDRTYLTEAALIEGYEFDRVRFRISGDSYRAADLTHWLALDVASQALADAGFPDAEGLPRESTGVLLGNSLAGEFSRANLLRLRWPYVRRVLEAELSEAGWSLEERHRFLTDLEARYKAPFPPVDEETLAGGLSNTIAGRICNYFDLKGGGYTVDGACASSLLAVANACSALAAGDLEVALAGGVDLSLDPFELVGFAKVGALAAEEMRVFDARSAGFWPGEGCGCVVLMRQEDALAQRRRIYTLIRGWGISSDGSGGLTRPEVEGQLLALRRAYRRAGFGIESVGYFEGHGTGTEVGDATELRVLSRARGESGVDAPPAAIGSIKANIGHTKAAAGVAGLIKAVMAVHTQVLPPTTGCEEPHPLLREEPRVLRVLEDGEPWPADLPLRAAVSAMGFGGINTHVVLEGAASVRRASLTPRERILLSSAQDAELFLFTASTPEELQRQIEHLASLAPALSRAELTDLAAHLLRSIDGASVRAAVLASSTAELARNLGILKEWLAAGAGMQVNSRVGVFIGGERGAPPRIGLLFPGQGSPAHRSGGVLRRRLPEVEQLYANVCLREGEDGIDTDVAQPAIITASLAALAILRVLGIEGCVGVGHSLGELAALHWGGALDRDAVLRIAVARGAAMMKLGSPTGMMLNVSASRDEVATLVDGLPVVIAGVNAPRYTVVAGEEGAVAKVAESAKARGWAAHRLSVSHAFHSPLVSAAARPLAMHLEREFLLPLARTVSSTVTGAPLLSSEDLRALLVRQVTSPVLFWEAVKAVEEDVDLWIEAGSGHTLAGLVGNFVEAPAVALDAGGPSIRGVLSAAAATWVLGGEVRLEALFAGRFSRPFDLEWRPRFFVNPCELSPAGEEEPGAPVARPNPSMEVEGEPASPASIEGSPPSALEVVRRLVAERVELPLQAVRDEHRLLADLHLNSITVSQLITQAARELGQAPPAAPTEYATATVAAIARALQELAENSGACHPIDEEVPAGVAAWVRGFTVELVECPLPRATVAASDGKWTVLASPEYQLADTLRRALTERAPGTGVAVCLPPNPDERQLGILLQGVHAALAESNSGRFLLVQHGGGAAALARTLYLEASGMTVCAVDVPAEHPDAAEWVAAEAAAADGYTEVHYDALGQRREPVLRLLEVESCPTAPLLGPDDVLLATGGGKGITAECALSLARETGVRLALLGKSRPEEDSDLTANLERISASGVRFHYLAADVTNAEEVRTAVREAEAALGPITAVLHGAAVNKPQLLSSLDEAAVLRTLAPKLQGVRNVIAAVDPKRLRLFLAFGSIIARIGVPGAGDYALANEWLAQFTQRFQADHPACRCLVLEWSIWSGIGMGARLGRVEALLRAGISPISPEDGIAVLHRLLSRSLPTVSLVVTGRFGDPPTLHLKRSQLPLLRFLEQPRIHYPGVELVTDAVLSVDSDPYLADHAVRGDQLLPAVLGLEAMAQAAAALTERGDLPVFERVRFDRPVVVPASGSVRIRLAALVRAPGEVEVALRCEGTSFQADHFRATCRFGADANLFRTATETEEVEEEVPINPQIDLYGDILFHSGRFRRLSGYRRLRARECIATLSPDGADRWFGTYLPTDLLLGDPGARDAAIHAVQACIPHALVLPVSVERLHLSSLSSTGLYSVHAREIAQQGDEFIFEVEIVGEDGTISECWERLRLRRADRLEPRDGWAIALLAPYFERRIGELVPGASLSVALERNRGEERRPRSDYAIGRALGATPSVRRRPDGKPEIMESPLAVSTSHMGELTLAVVGSTPVGCDIELVVARPGPMWQDLLGPARRELAEVLRCETGENEAEAATRVWVASESLRKAGTQLDAPLIAGPPAGDGWVLLSAGPLTVATVVTRIQGLEERVAVGIVLQTD